MNSENFSDYIKEVSNLYQISYQELKSLVLQYPYCQNLHVLLLLKSKMDQHKDLDKNLNLAAAYSLDRAHMLKQFQAIDVSSIQSEHLILREDYLELKDLSEVEEVEKIEVETTDEVVLEETEPGFLTSKLQQESEAIKSVETNPFLNSSGKDYEDINLSDALLNGLLKKMPEEISEPAIANNGTQNGIEPVENVEEIKDRYFVPPSIIKNAASVAAFLPSLSFDEFAPVNPPVLKTIAPLPKTSFNSWAQKSRPSFTDLQPVKTKESSKPKSKKKKKKVNKAILFAQKSIVENEEIATETLAELLISQNQPEKAIIIYQRLKNLYPEQNPYFDQKIGELS